MARPKMEHLDDAGSELFRNLVLRVSDWHVKACVVPLGNCRQAESHNHRGFVCVLGIPGGSLAQQSSDSRWAFVDSLPGGIYD